MGRPTKYKEEYCDELIDFFDKELTREIIKTVITKTGEIVEIPEEVATDLPLFQSFAHEIGVCVDTLQEWKSKHDEFSSAYKRAKDLQMIHLVTNGLQGRYSNSFAIFTAKNILKWRDKPPEEIIKEDKDGRLIIKM